MVVQYQALERLWTTFMVLFVILMAATVALIVFMFYSLHFHLITKRRDLYAYERRQRAKYKSHLKHMREDKNWVSTDGPLIAVFGDNQSEIQMNIFDERESPEMDEKRDSGFKMMPQFE